VGRVGRGGPAADRVGVTGRFIAQPSTERVNPPTSSHNPSQSGSIRPCHPAISSFNRMMLLRPMVVTQPLRPWLMPSGPFGPGACRTLNDQPSTINSFELSNIQTPDQRHACQNGNDPRASSPEPRVPRPESRAPSLEPRTPTPDSRLPSPDALSPSPQPRAPPPPTA